MEETNKKPIAKVKGENENVFNLIGICSRALKKEGKEEDAKEMTKRIMACQGYEEALGIMAEYCELM